MEWLIVIVVCLAGGWWFFSKLAGSEDDARQAIHESPGRAWAGITVGAIAVIVLLYILGAIAGY